MDGHSACATCVAKSEAARGWQHFLTVSYLEQHIVDEPCWWKVAQRLCEHLASAQVVEGHGSREATLNDDEGLALAALEQGFRCRGQATDVHASLASEQGPVAGNGLSIVERRTSQAIQSLQLQRSGSRRWRDYHRTVGTTLEQCCSVGGYDAATCTGIVPVGRQVAIASVVRLCLWREVVAEAPTQLSLERIARHRRGKRFVRPRMKQCVGRLCFKQGCGFIKV